VSRTSVATFSHFLREDVDLADAVPTLHRLRAVEECVATTIRVDRGPWIPRFGERSGEGIGLLLLHGLMIRRVGIDGRFGAELLGEGDLLRPWQSEDDLASFRPTTGWRVLQTTRMADLDAAVARRMSRYPELTGRLVGRALARSRHLTVNMAIVHQARVTTRVHMMLWHLAGRWGRVRSDGVMIPFRLTHAVLADLVAARRPTVSSALGELTRRALLKPERGAWILLGEPPGELLEVQEVRLPH
jgi:hypothetical protein